MNIVIPVDAAGGKELVTASDTFTITKSSSSGTVRSGTLSCGFDPLVVFSQGSNWFGGTYASACIFRVSRDAPWQTARNTTQGLSVSGRTITASFEAYERYDTAGYIYAFGYAD